MQAVFLNKIFLLRSLDKLCSSELESPPNIRSVITDLIVRSITLHTQEIRTTMVKIQIFFWFKDLEEFEVTHVDKT